MNTGLRHFTARLLGGLKRLPAGVLILLTRAYQLLISPWLGPHCRFTPTCSQYMIESVRRHGAAVGFFRGLKRIFKCHPFHPGGHDPP